MYMQLSSHKYVDGIPKVKSVDDTLKHVAGIAYSIGVTRVADITHLDVLRIPNYSAVLPGSIDNIWVYSGKGPTHKHAKASALMESIERYSALASNFRYDGNNRVSTGSMNEMIMRHGRGNVLHVDDVVEAVSFNYNDHMPMDFIECYDIMNRNYVYVPAGLILTRYDLIADKSGKVNPFLYSHTNGLAAGNTIEEAIVQGLCEVIERDAVSIAELRSSVLAYHRLKSIITRLNSQGIKVKDISSDDYVDDPDIYPKVDLTSVENKYARFLISRFEREGIPLLVKDITSDTGIPTFIATSIQWITDDYAYMAEGHGTHPNKDVALIRAVTEVAQTRAANIQGARDDLRRMRYDVSKSAEHRAWQFMHSSRKIDYSSIPTYEHDDVLDDIEFILSRLRTVGLDKVVVADLTHDRTKVPVVRVIVPGLETFKVSRSVVGVRGMRYA